MPLNAAQQKIVDKVFGPGRVGEAVVDVCSGTVASPTMAMEHSGYIFVTSERVVLRLKTIGGWHTLDFQPAMIASIEQGNGLGGGRLTILASGSANEGTPDAAGRGGPHCRFHSSTHRRGLHPEQREATSSGR